MSEPLVIVGNGMAATRLVRELAAWLAGQGVRPTDSLVIRAALRTAQTGAGLLQAYRRAAELDGRLKRHKVK